MKDITASEALTLAQTGKIKQLKKKKKQIMEGIMIAALEGDEQYAICTPMRFKKELREWLEDLGYDVRDTSMSWIIHFKKLNW